MIFEGNLQNIFFFFFPRAPKPASASPPFKYMEVVRKQDERKKLGTSSCKECENVGLLILSSLSFFLSL